MNISQLKGFLQIGSFQKSTNIISLGKLKTDPDRRVFWALVVKSEVMYIAYLEKERLLSKRLRYVEVGNGKKTYNRLYNNMMKLQNGAMVDIFIHDFDSTIPINAGRSQLNTIINNYKNDKTLPWD